MHRSLGVIAKASVVIQWGEFTGNVTGSSVRYVDYNISYLERAYATCSATGVEYEHSCTTYAADPTKFGLSWWNNGVSYTGTFWWISCGK